MGEATIICLAKSRKGGKCCVAGRLFDGTSVGAWIRLVTTREGGPVAPQQTCCTDGIETAVGEIVTIPLRGYCPHGHQTENCLIDTTKRWQRHGRASWITLYAAQDRTDDSFWEDHGHGSHGVRDRIPELRTSGAGGSLRLVYVSALRIAIHRETSMFRPTRRTVRAEFQVNGMQFKVVVSDPWVEERYRAQPEGDYDIGMAMLCVSLGELFKGFAYRLAAAVITPDRCEARA
ncbi:MAG: dual OB domain-containing protein [Gammaproteobacteria bacterium]